MYLYIYTDLEILSIDFKYAQIYCATFMKNTYQGFLSLKKMLIFTNF